MAKSAVKTTRSKSAIRLGKGRRKQTLPKRNVVWTNFGEHFAKMSSKFGSQPITSMIGVIATASVLVSVAHQAGYLCTLDPRLLSFFSIQDAITNAIPVVPVMAALSILLLFSFHLLTEGFFERMQQEVMDGPPASGRAIWWTYFLLILMILLAILSTFFVQMRIIAFILVILLVMLLLGELVHKKSHLPQAAILWWTIGITAFTLIFAAIGEAQAINDLSSKERDYRMTVNGDTFDVLLLTANAETLIVRDDPRTIRVLRRDQVSEIKILNVGQRLSRWSFTAIWRWAFPVQPSNGYRGR